MGKTYSVILTSRIHREAHLDTVRTCIMNIRYFSDLDDVEFIVSDDASEFGADELREHADIYIRRKTPLGCAWGWNQGLKVANGEYLIVISDDVFVGEGWIKGMRDALDKFPRAMVSSLGLTNVFDQKGIQESRVWFPGWIFMFRRETLDKVGYFDQQFMPFNYEDVDYWTRVYKAGYTTARNFDIKVQHKEGQVIHNVEGNGEIDKANRERYLKKWGFDPIPVLYGGGKFPWE